MKEKGKYILKYWLLPLIIEYAMIIFVYCLKNKLVSNFFVLGLIIVKCYFISKYCVFRFVNWKKVKDKFKLFTPLSFILLFTYIMLSVSFDSLLGVKIMIKPVVSIVVFISLVVLITSTLGSYIKKVKITQTDNGVFLLAITMSSTFVYIEERIYKLLAFGEYLKNVLLIITSFVWIFYLIFDNICAIRKKRKNIKYYFVFILQILLTITLNIFTVYELFYDDINLFNGIISVYAALVGGSLTLAGVAWTIRHEKEEKRKEVEQEKLNSSPLVYFKGIDKIRIDKSSTIVGGNNVLMHNKIKGKKSKDGLLFRLNFGNNNQAALKQITFKNISIYSNFKCQEDMGIQYLFESNYKTDKNRVNLSSIEKDLYQVAFHLVMGENEFEKMCNDLNDKELFIDLSYEVININNVHCYYDLKFNCKLLKKEEEYRISKISNISNWIDGNPEIL